MGGGGGPTSQAPWKVLRPFSRHRPLPVRRVVGPQEWYYPCFCPENSLPPSNSPEWKRLKRFFFITSVKFRPTIIVVAIPRSLDPSRNPRQQMGPLEFRTNTHPAFCGGFPEVRACALAGVQKKGKPVIFSNFPPSPFLFMLLFYLLICATILTPRSSHNSVNAALLLYRQGLRRLFFFAPFPLFVSLPNAFRKSLSSALWPFTSKTLCHSLT